MPLSAIIGHHENPMPKPKTLASYPTSYLELISYFFTGERKPVLVLPFNSEREAKAYRFDLYGFRQALTAEQHPLAREATSLFMFIRGCDLHIAHRDAMPDPIKAALSSLGVQTLTIAPPIRSEQQRELELAAEHDETDEQLSTADEQADLIANFFKDK
jgi:hypothetical protein